jgi:hypothetical protein
MLAEPRLIERCRQFAGIILQAGQWRPTFWMIDMARNERKAILQCACSLPSRISTAHMGSR